MDITDKIALISGLISGFLLTAWTILNMAADKFNFKNVLVKVSSYAIKIFGHVLVWFLISYLIFFIIAVVYEGITGVKISL